MKTLSAKNISLTLGKKILYKNLHLSFQPGEIWGLLGANGSGKTTLLLTLSGINSSDGIWLNEQNLRHLSPRNIAQEIAILFQDTHYYFSQTVWEYCLMARYPHQNYFKKITAHDQQIVRQALQKMELDHYQKRAITQLSGGEKRRLAIASVLSQTPRIYLLDEPTNHLDVRHQMQTLNYFRELAQGDHATIILSLHDINLAQRYCTHLLLLFPNEQVLQGKTKDVLNAENLTRLYQYPIRTFYAN